MIKTKHFWLLIVLLIFPAIAIAKAPQWVSQHPVSASDWWGIGVSPVSNPDHVNIAAKNAINEIAHQIYSNVQSRSFLGIQEVDYATHEVYRQQVLVNTQNYIEGLEVYGTYKDKNNYYVCYRLNKSEYERRIQAKSLEIANLGFDYLQKAQEALEKGNLVNANLNFAKGLEVVEPWLFLDLTYQNVNIPVALFNGYNSVFDGISLTLQENTMQADCFQPLNISIPVFVERNGTPLHNIPIKSLFIEGSGVVNEKVITNSYGKAVFTLTHIYSKAATQQIKFFIDKSFMQTIPQIYQEINAGKVLPEVLLTIKVNPNEINAFLYAKENLLPSCLHQVASVLANEHVTAVTDESKADMFVEISTTYKQQGFVQGDLGNLYEYSASLRLIFFDDKHNVLLTYPIEDLRVLVDENASQSQVKAQCTKDIMKRVRRELPNKLKHLITNRPARASLTER